MPRHRPGHRRLPRLAAATLATLAAGACVPASRPGAIAPTPAEDAAASPVVHARQGLEIRWWVVADRHADVARTLAPYAGPPAGADPDTLLAWQRSGLRLVAVPLDELTGVRDALPRIGATNQQWVGQSASWLDALGGPVFDRPVTVVVDQDTITLPPGQLRLLIRDWLVPEMTADRADARLHVEILPELRERVASARTLADDLLAPEPPSRTIDPLRMTLRLDAGNALLIVSERPDIAWNEVADAAEADPEDVGPPVPSYPTLGATMLTSSPNGLGATVNKAIVVLIPRVPDRFELTQR